MSRLYEDSAESHGRAPAAATPRAHKFIHPALLIFFRSLSARFRVTFASGTRGDPTASPGSSG